MRLKISCQRHITGFAKESLVSAHLTAGKIGFTESSALSYQDEGATFCV